MLPFINIHCHQIIGNDLSIQNIDLLDFSLHQIQHPFSLGLHPWSIDKNEISDIKKKLNATLLKEEKFLMAIGETGIDKGIHIPIKLQENIFKFHIELAAELKKPLILHCVRSFNEIHNIIRQMKFNMPVIVHGFNNNIHIAESCFAHGYYLSFGAALLNEQSNARKVLKAISNDRFFLETDDSNISIEQIYEAATSVKNISMIELLQIQNHNFEQVFKTINK